MSVKLFKNFFAMAVTSLVIASGCTTTQAPEPIEEPVPKHVCSTCAIEPVVEHKKVYVSECTQPVTVVTYRDHCSSCGDIPVTVRSYGLSSHCR